MPKQAATYDLGALPLYHGFHDTLQDRRYPLSAPARREVLARLLQLNHARAQTETASAGQPEGKPGSSRAKTPRGKKKGEEGPPRLL